MQTHNAGVVGSNRVRVITKTPLVSKATGNYLIKSISLDKLRALSLVSATLEIEYALQLYFIDCEVGFVFCMKRLIL